MPFDEGTINQINDDSSIYKIGNNIFVGDTIFKNSIGRTDLPGGNRKHLIASLEKLLNLPGHTIIYPGHGSKTLLKNERDNIIKYLKNQ